MTDSSEITDVLNDLILINNDRIAGYQKAYEETNETDADLRSLFNNLSNDSRANVEELKAEVSRLGDEPAAGTMLSGKLYRAWMDVKAVFSSDDRKAALENAEFGEDAAQKAYDMALKSDDLSDDMRSLIIRQKVTLLRGHDTIKARRDAERAKS